MLTSNPSLSAKVNKINSGVPVESALQEVSGTTGINRLTHTFYLKEGKGLTFPTEVSPFSGTGGKGALSPRIRHKQHRAADVRDDRP